MAIKKPIKVVEVERDMARIWNISDDPSTEVEATILQLVGRNVAPGRAVKVDKSIAESKSIQKAVDAGLVYVGETPPQEYMKAKGLLAKARMPDGHVRSHG